MANDLPNGVYAATLMPLNSDLSCNHKRLALHCFDLLERGCEGIALFGTTGEGPSFSVAERKEALKELIAAGMDPKKIILGNGSSGIADTVELAKDALNYGCAAMLIAPPSFFKKISDSGVIAYYREIIQRVNDPNLHIILYHIPQYSGVPISLEVACALHKEFPEIVIGLKESEGNLAYTKKLLQMLPDFKVFVGNEGHIIESVHLGGAGTICGIANLYPELICSLYEQGKKFLIPNPPRLEAIFQSLQGLSFIPAAKALMEARQGADWHALRPPLVPLDAHQSKVFISSLKD